MKCTMNNILILLILMVDKCYHVLCRINFKLVCRKHASVNYDMKMLRDYRGFQ